MKFIQESLTFDDVLLVPQHSDIESRISDVSVASTLGNGDNLNLELSIPIISSPMDTVTESEMAGFMWTQGGLGIIHRYASIAEQCKMVKDVIDKYYAEEPLVGAAVGATGDYLERTIGLLEAGAKVICVDVAHGDHILVHRAIKEINKLHNRKKFHLMAGNVATGEAFLNLAACGVDSIRVGIGGGSICSTRLNTGFGVPNLSAIFDCITKWEDLGLGDNRPSLIVDGGIRNAGDIVKALAAGADFVMCGSLLARHLSESRHSTNR